MDFKKLVSLLAVSTLALAACDTDEEPAEPENGEENGDAEEGASDSQSLIEGASERSGDAFPDYTLEIAGHAGWTEEGYLVPAEDGEVTIAAVAGGEDFSVYFTEADGTIIEVVENEEEVTFTVPEPEEETNYGVGVSPEDLGGEGDTVDSEDFARYENILATPALEEEEVEEE